MKRKIKWGIIAPGRIAESFAHDLKLLEDTEITSVASREYERAENFAQKFGIKEIFGSYDEFYKNSSAEVVYIASPHVFHKEQALKCIEAGKAVVCEKPVALNASDVREIINAAAAKGVFFMEAMWTKFLPVIRRVKEIVDSGAIGEVKMVKADFCFDSGYNPKDRLYDKALGGGSLLDVGIYPITFAHMIMKEKPIEITTDVVMAETGVDMTGSYILKFSGGRVASLNSSIGVRTPNDALIIGTKGYIGIFDFWMAQRAEIVTSDGNEEIISGPFTGNGYYHEAQEVNKCLNEGVTESLVVTHADTLCVMEIMDTIREKWGLKYPDEC